MSKHIMIAMSGAFYSFGVLLTFHYAFTAIMAHAFRLRASSRAFESQLRARVSRFDKS